MHNGTDDKTRTNRATLSISFLICGVIGTLLQLEDEEFSNFRRNYLLH